MQQVQIRRSVSTNEPPRSSTQHRDANTTQRMDGVTIVAMLVVSWVFGFVCCVGVAMLIRS